ncbi:hypothetical protein RO21_10360 [[Actinobacillus] muris]|uniref:HTH cro/C1-type domain-containing protein n=1 Tax=Muribacter muris TaxID=67855 RepID=A0A0J5P5C9_9PAST|nr:helix-turn-helix domain-containing protein [Muribacter muris]KMK50689.1 hypothetical protein RO21_10360 [[Actinobacillus] muris] [Muribacter muris]
MVFNTEAVILRMRQVLSAGNNEELADKLGTSHSTIQKWEEVNAIPFNDLAVIARDTNVTLDWLVYGKSDDGLSVDEEMILTAYRNLPKKQKIEAINYMSKLDSFGATEKKKAVAQNAVLKGDHNFIGGDINIHQG